MDCASRWLDFPERLAPGQRWLPYALLLAVTFALYASTLFFQFVWDDTAYILENFRIRALDWSHLQLFWTHTYLGHYAPVHHTFLALLYQISGLEPFGYHLGQVLTHAACVCLLYLVLRKMESARVALLAGLLFAVHPTHIETVAWIAESKSTLAFLLFLLSFWFFIRFRERSHWTDGALSGVLLALSVLAKVNTVVAPAIFLLYDYKQGASLKSLRWRSLACFFLLSAGFAVLHVAIFHRSQHLLASAYFGGLAVHLLNLPLFILFYLRMAFFPHPLSAAHMFRVYSEWNWIVAVAWLALLLVLVLLYFGDRHVRFWGLWFLVFLAPAMQIIPNPIWVADRYLYVPVAGALVLVSRLFFYVSDGIRRLWIQAGWQTAMAGILLALAWQTTGHLPVWRSDLSLWEATTETCMEAASCHVNLGLALMAAGQPQRGGDELVHAVQLQPAPLYLMYLGDALALSARNYPEAIRMYRLALQGAAASGGSVSPALVSEFYAKLARAHILSGNYPEAASAIQAGINSDSSNPQLWVAAVFLNWKQSNLGAARQSLAGLLQMTSQSSPMAAAPGGPAGGVLAYYWGDASEIGGLLADLRSSDAPSPPATGDAP